MTSRRAWIAGMVGMALASPAAMAQVAPVPSGAGAAAQESPPHSGGQEEPPRLPRRLGSGTANTFGFFGLSKANLAACRDRLLCVADRPDGQ